jgi:hypothetical protein
MRSEKRRDPRFDVEQKLWCEGQDNMEARNMSRSGMFIMTDQPREVGEEITISFDGDDGGTIEVKAEVMRKVNAKPGDKAGLGLRIVGFGQGEDAYDRFVQKQLEEQGLDGDGGSKKSG